MLLKKLDYLKPRINGSPSPPVQTRFIHGEKDNFFCNISQCELRYRWITPIFISISNQESVFVSFLKSWLKKCLTLDVTFTSIISDAVTYLELEFQTTHFEKKS